MARNEQLVRQADKVVNPYVKGHAASTKVAEQKSGAQRTKDSEMLSGISKEKCIYIHGSEERPVVPDRFEVVDQVEKADMVLLKNRYI